MGPHGNNADRIADLELRLREQERYTATQGRAAAPFDSLLIRNAISAKRPLEGEEEPEDVEYEPSARPWIIFTNGDETPRSETGRIRAQTRDGSVIDTEGQKLTVYFYGGRWWIATECGKKTFQLERCVPAEESESDAGYGDPPRLLVFNQFEPSDIGRSVRTAEYPDSCYTIAAEPCVPEEGEETPTEETDDAAIERINECLTPICVEVLEIFDDCAACLCEYETPVVPLTICGSDPVEIIYANKLAETDEAVEVDLTEHKDEIVRLDDGRCASVGVCMELPAEETAEDVIVLEFYDAATGEEEQPCDSCVITLLRNCNDSEDVKYTYTDLGAWSNLDYIPDLDSDPRQCYQKDHSEDPIEWDPMDPPVRFNAGEYQEFASCDECRGEVIYRGTYNCTPDECPAGADPVADIVTADPALAGFDGKFGVVEGLAYEWEIDETAVEGDITHETVETTGPFDTCPEALAEPISLVKKRYGQVFIQGDLLKQRYEWEIIRDGILVGICPGGSETIGTWCCDAPFTCGDCITIVFDGLVDELAPMNGSKVLSDGIESDETDGCVFLAEYDTGTFEIQIEVNPDGSYSGSVSKLTGTHYGLFTAPAGSFGDPITFDQADEPPVDATPVATPTITVTYGPCA